MIEIVKGEDDLLLFYYDSMYLFAVDYHQIRTFHLDTVRHMDMLPMFSISTPLTHYVEFVSWESKVVNMKHFLSDVFICTGGYEYQIDTEKIMQCITELTNA